MRWTFDVAERPALLNDRVAPYWRYCGICPAIGVPKGSLGMKRSSLLANASGQSGPPSDRNPRPTGFHVLDSEPNTFVFGCWKNVLIAIWKSQATAPNVERFKRAIELMTERTPGYRSNVHVIVEGAALPTAEARAALVALMNRGRDALASVVIVVDGTGFWSSALRSAMTGLRTLAPNSFGFHVAATVDDVVDWLPADHELRTGVKLDPARLGDVLRFDLSSSDQVLRRGGSRARGARPLLSRSPAVVGVRC